MNTKQQLMKIYDEMYQRFGPQHWWPGHTKTEIIGGAILTQNTNWGNVEKALSNMKKAKLLNFSALQKTSEQRIAELIRPSGYFNIKAKRLKNFVNFFYEEYHGSWKKIQQEPFDILRKKILSVNGIGPETADSILLYALNRPVFVVDAYTKRIFSRHGLINHRTDYDTVQQLFMGNLPHDVQLFNEYHALIVRAAKEYCRTKPQYKGCPLCTLLLEPC